MALKVSITLPGQAVITVEATEPEVFREVVSIALRELPRELVKLQLAETGSNGAERAGKSVPPPVADAAEEPGLGHDTPSAEAPGERTNAEEAFTRFAASISPVGDMRRVVVAAEGARKFLGMESVSDGELVGLFDLAGWHRPGDFLQTLRNAARSKFRWLERVPGSPGYYSVSRLGRDAVVGNGDG